MKPVILIILDGFGEGKAYNGNAITLAKTPVISKLKKEFTWTTLKASGTAVGIPDGMQGGSEVGHFTIGAGRIVYQTQEEINISINSGEFFKKPALLEACKRVRETNKSALHLLGMISDQGVHSHIDHLFALLKTAKNEKVPKVYIHAIADGRDVPEHSAGDFILKIQNKIAELGMEKIASIATIVGRYYAMDRDSNWDRTSRAYDLYTLGKGFAEKDPLEAIANAYKRGNETDYYIEPIILDEHGVFKDKDSVIFWNYRTDRSRQLTWAFTGEKNPLTQEPIGFKQEKIVRPFFVCFGHYSEKAPVLFPFQIVKNNLAEVISKAGLKQFRIAETEKYAHVTFFFNSQIETPYPGEERLLIHSPKCPSYAEKPEMSAREVTKAAQKIIESKKFAFIVLNYANCDLVGHSGDLKASIKAVEVVDECLGKIIPIAQENGFALVITGDHGNVEHKIYEENGEPSPSHTLNPVPVIVIETDSSKIKNGGELKDIAPTVLKIMGIKQPKEMTGLPLI